MRTPRLVRYATLCLHFAAGATLSATPPGGPAKADDGRVYASATLSAHTRITPVRAATTSATSAPGDRTAGARPATTAVPTTSSTPADAVGRGWLERATCLGCAGIILGVGGGSVAGLVILAGVFPEAVIGCGAVCVLAFG